MPDIKQARDKVSRNVCVVDKHILMDKLDKYRLYNQEKEYLGLSVGKMFKELDKSKLLI